MICAHMWRGPRFRAIAGLLLLFVSVAACAIAAEEPTQQLSITVIDSSDGRPLPGAEIRISQGGAEAIRSVYTERSGTAEVRGVTTTESLRLDVRFQGFARFTKDYKAPLSLPSESIQVALEPFMDLSIVGLLSHPREHEGRAVRVMGYLVHNQEEQALYLHEEDFDNSLTSNAVTVHAYPDIEPLLSQLSRGYVLLEGRFRVLGSPGPSTYLGHLVEVQRAVEMKK